MNKVWHTIDPFYDASSKILILGSMPSIVSRQVGFYYAHPSNRFWKVLELVFEEKIKDKKAFLKNKHIALWDVCKSCEINSSSDSSIKNVVVNDLNLILDVAKIKAIFTTGNVAYKYLNKYYPNLNIAVIKLPSTSSANAKYSLNDLKKEYLNLKKYLK